MKNNHKRINGLESALIAKLARSYNYAPVSEVLEGFARVITVIRREVSEWTEVPIERRRVLLAALGHASAEAMRAFDAECTARDDNE